MASANWSHVSNENSNFARLCKLLVDGGTRVLREVFTSTHTPHLLQSHLLKTKNHGILKNLLTKKVLFKEQWDKLYPTGGSTVDSKGFDITLLCVLLRSICHLKKPLEGWNDLPQPTSTNREDDIVRIKLYRNRLYGHIKEAAISDNDFNNYWDEIASVLVRLGGADYQEQIDKLKVESLDPSDKKYYIQCLEEWAKNDEKIMEKLEEVMSKMNELGEKMDEANQELKKVAGMLQTASLALGHIEETTPQDADSYSQNLRSAMKIQLEMHQEFINSPIIENMKIEDIFTNLIMHLKSGVLGGKRLTKISKRDIFLPKGEKENPKSILINGNPGIGKSLFCRKLVHEWTQDCSFIPDIRFAFLLTFRQLNMLTDRELNLRELLNLCSMLDESVMLNDSIMEHIIQHPNQLFIVVDGFDEYKQSERHKMVGDFESSYPNDPRLKMPVTALVSKLIKKKILRDSVVLATSRPDEANGMKYFHFDRHVEITGFTKEQIVEYVGKYFSSNKEMQTKALGNIQQNEEYASLGRVPLMCLLMCVYMEFHLEESKECFPKTLTDFYSKVLLCIESKCNKAILKAGLDKTTASLAVKRNLDIFSELAAQSFVHEKYGFDDEDLGNLNLSEDELTFFKSSSLFFCEASIRKSPFSELLHVYSFCHATIQEYFAARYFVQMNTMPAHNTESKIFFEFMAGLAGSMDPEKHEELMRKLLECISKDEYSSSRQLSELYEAHRTSVKCLYSYGNKEFAKGIVKLNEHNMYVDRNGWIFLYSFSDCNVATMLVDIFTALNQEKSLPSNSRVPYYLYINNYPEQSLSGVETLFISLSKDLCTITVLKLYSCSIDDECTKCLSKYLPETQITNLDLTGNKITYDGAMSILPFCKSLAYLGLRGNFKISIEGEIRIRELFKEKYPDLVLDI